VGGPSSFHARAQSSDQSRVVELWEVGHG
jgi:hypothetical protein